ncbi:GNAT family acetyltransferase [Seiridium cupressi]
MSLPSQNPSGGPSRAQASIRSFFQPTTPKYAAPPSASRPAQPQPNQQPSPPQGPYLQQHQSPPPPEAPPPPPQSDANGNGTVPTTSSAPVPVPAPTPTHHPNITLSPILPSHIPSLKHLTARLLPVRYPETFYVPLSDPLSSGAFSRVLLWTDTPTPSNPSPKPTVIGGLVCRPQATFQPRPNSAQDVISDALYIQSLVLQEPYRGLGLAARMLEEVCTLASHDERFMSRTVCAHVWTENAEGWEWYRARGFKKVEPVIEGYYRQLRPSDAWIVRREIGTGAVSRAGGGVLDAVKANGIGSGSNEQAKEPIRNKGASTPSVASFTSATPPLASRSPASPGPRPGPPCFGTSYQNKGPENEWNDLPEEMVSAPRSNNLSVPGSGANSGTSSRSSSTAGRKKRDRAYPAAAFGN